MTHTDFFFFFFDKIINLGEYDYSVTHIPKVNPSSIVLSLCSFTKPHYSKSSKRED